MSTMYRFAAFWTATAFTPSAAEIIDFRSAFAVGSCVRKVRSSAANSVGAATPLRSLRNFACTLSMAFPCWPHRGGLTPCVSEPEPMQTWSAPLVAVTWSSQKPFTRATYLLFDGSTDAVEAARPEDGSADGFAHAANPSKATKRTKALLFDKVPFGRLNLDASRFKVLNALVQLFGFAGDLEQHPALVAGHVGAPDVGDDLELATGLVRLDQGEPVRIRERGGLVHCAVGWRRWGADRRGRDRRRRRVFRRGGRGVGRQRLADRRLAARGFDDRLRDLAGVNRRDERQAGVVGAGARVARGGT